MASLRKFEWEAIAGLIAAVTAIVLHFLHLTDINILRVITLVLVALLFLRDLRSEERWSSMEDASKLSVRLLEEIKETTHPTEIDLIGPQGCGRRPSSSPNVHRAKWSGSMPARTCSKARRCAT